MRGDIQPLADLRGERQSREQSVFAPTLSVNAANGVALETEPSAAFRANAAHDVRLAAAPPLASDGIWECPTAWPGRFNGRSDPSETISTA